METIARLVTIIYAILALVGAFLVVYTAYVGRKADSALLRARAFLNESFMKDSWTLLFLACLLFLINAAMSMNEMFGIFIEEGESALIAELTEAGIMACIVMLAYKWFKLVNPAEHPEQVAKQEAHSAKKTTGEISLKPQDNPFLRNER